MDQYPKAKYNASAQQKVVGSLEEEQALGEGWGDHPAGPFVNKTLAAPEPEAPKPVKKKKVEED